MKRILFLIIVLVLIIATSCENKDLSEITEEHSREIIDEPIICKPPYIRYSSACCLDKNANKICDEHEETTEEKIEKEIDIEPVIEEKIEAKPLLINELPDRNFTIEELQNFLNELTYHEYKFETINKSAELYPYEKKLLNQNHNLFWSNNKDKAFVIHEIREKEEQLETIEKFYNFAKAKNWETWKTYINQSDWNLLMDPLSEEELKKILPEYPYKDYSNYVHSDLVDINIKEITKKTPQKRQVLEWYMTTMIFDQFGYMQSNWESFLLIYKIPCSKDLIIYYRPRWETDFQMTWFNQKKESIDRTWENGLMPVRSKYINYSEKIMDFCGINSEIFNNVNFKSYESLDKQVFNWQVYFRLFYNHTFNANVSIKETNRENQYMIDKISAKFISYDEYALPYLSSYKLPLSMRIIINDSGNLEEFFDASFRYRLLKKGEIIEFDYGNDHNFKFSNESSIIIMPYFGWEDTSKVWRDYIGPPLIKKLEFNPGT